jgi:hypothetical protein
MTETILKSALGVLYVFFAPIVPIILIVGLFVIIDTIFGIMAAKHSNENISSNKFSRIIYKTFAYFSVILLAYGLDYLIVGAILTHYFPLITLLFTKLIAAIIGVVEWYSIDEKIRKMNKNRGIKFYVYLLLRNAKKLSGSIKDIKSDLKDDNDQPINEAN